MRTAFACLTLVTLFGGCDSAESPSVDAAADAALLPGDAALVDFASADGGGSGPPHVSGLMMRDGVPPIAKENFITSSVLAIGWSQIEATQGTFDWTPFDTQLAALAAANVTHVKVRLFSGGQAPPWVKRLGSSTGYQNSTFGVAIDCSPTGGANWGGVAVQNMQGPKACIPFFWTPAYQSAYDAVMRALSARLMSDPKYDRVTTIVDSSCMAVYAEVFYRGQTDGPTNQTLAAAGLTPALDWACQTAAIQTHASAFGRSRRTALAINDWDLVQSTPQPDQSYRLKVWYGAPMGLQGTYEFVEQVARPTLGTDLLEVQNNGLHTTTSCASGGTATTSTSCYLKLYPGRHGHQTEGYVATPLSPSGASLTLLQDLDQGLLLNAQFIELPNANLMTDADWALMPCYNTNLLTGQTTACPH